MAINFPSTGGRPTDGTFTYTTAGITYSWNGESWTAAGSGATATDRTVFSATNTTSSGNGSLAYNSNNGVFTFTPPDLSSYLTSTGVLNSHIDVNHGTPSDGDVLAWNGPNLKWENTAAGAGGGLDSDLLDGQQGSFYQDASNLVSGILSSDRLSGTYAIDISGTSSGIPNLSGVGDVNITSLSSGQVIRYTGSEWVNSDSPSVRKSVSFTATNLNNGSSLDFSITTPNTYALLKVSTSHAAWVTLYTDTTSRTNDASRSQDTDPSPGSGVIAEVISASATTQLITPSVIGFSSTQNNITYGKVVNNSGTQVNLQITLTYVPLEA